MEKFFRDLSSRIFPDSGPFSNSAVHVLLVLVLAVVAWWVLNVVVGRLRKKYGDRPLFRKHEGFLLLVKRAGRYLILVLVGAGLLKLFRAPLAEKVFLGIMILLFCNVARSIVDILISYLESTIVTRTRNKVDDVLLDLTKKFSGIIIYATGVVLALDALGFNIMPFVAGAGVAGIAIGFAAKDTLSNLIAGVLLIIDRPFEMGDRIEIWTAPKNSATWGDVIDIGLRATKIRTTDNIVVVIPNNEIMKRDIINYTTITKEIRVRIPIGIAYDADTQKAKDLIRDVALELDWVMRDPPPRVVVRNFGESSVDLQARVWIGDPRRRMDTISHVTDRIKTVFQEKGIEIPYPKRDIYIKRETS